MPTSVLEQTLPVLALSSIVSKKNEDDDGSTTGPSPDGSDGGQSPVSGSVSPHFSPTSTPGRSTCSPWAASSTVRWADIESDEEEEEMKLLRPTGPPPAPSAPPSLAGLMEVQTPPPPRTEVSKTKMNSKAALFAPNTTNMSSKAAAFTPNARNMSSKAAAFTPTATNMYSKAPAFMPEKMSSSAPAFNPQSKENVQRLVRVDFASVVAAGLKTMRGSCAALSSEVRESAGGWTLSCRLHPGVDANSMLPALQSQVQAAMLQAAEVSKMVYILGYEHQPFTPSYDSFGFSLQLAAVHDDSNVCWDLLSKGHCKHGRFCCRHHPAEQVAVEVNFTM